MNNSQSYGKFRLQKAIRQYECEYYSSLPQAEEPICHSDRYLKKMNHLCRRSAPSFRFPALGMRKAAAVALLTAVLLVTGLFSVSATRNAVSEWFVSVYESFTEIFSIRWDTEAVTDSVETVYAPTVLPDGYVLRDEYLAQSEAKFTWENVSEERIFFIQTPLNSKSTFDNDEAASETGMISGVKCYVVQKNGKICIYWSTREYAFTLIVPETVTPEQYANIIASVQQHS